MYKLLSLLTPWRVFSLFGVLVITTPIITIFSNIFFGLGDSFTHLLHTVLSKYIINSFILVIGVAILTSIFGFIGGWLSAFYQFPFSKFFSWALILPLVFPTYIMAYIYAGMFDYTGFMTTFFLKIFNLTYQDVTIPEIMSMEGAILVMSLVLYPYVFLMVKTSLLTSSFSLQEAGRTLGANSFKIFYKIILPMARPAIVAGVSLAIMESLSDFGTVDYYGIDTFTTGIFRTWFGMGDLSSASSLAAILMIFVFTIISIEKLQRGNKGYSSKKIGNFTKVKLSKFYGFLAFLFCFIIFFLGFLLPLFQILYWGYLSLDQIYENEFIKSFLNTLTLATISSIIITIIALFFVYIKRVMPSKFSINVLKISSLGYSIPGAVIAIGVLIAIGLVDHKLSDLVSYIFKIDTGLILSGTIFAIIFGYTVRFFAISANTIESGFEKVPINLYYASRMLGLSKLKTLIFVDLKLIKNSIFASMILIFVEVAKELPATMILQPFNFSTLALRTYELAKQDMIIESSISSLSIVLISLIPIIFLTKTVEK